MSRRSLSVVVLLACSSLIGGACSSSKAIPKATTTTAPADTEPSSGPKVTSPQSSLIEAQFFFTTIRAALPKQCLSTRLRRNITVGKDSAEPAQGAQGFCDVWSSQIEVDAFPLAATRDLYVRQHTKISCDGMNRNAEHLSLAGLNWVVRDGSASLFVSPDIALYMAALLHGEYHFEKCASKLNIVPSSALVIVQSLTQIFDQKGLHCGTPIVDALDPIFRTEVLISAKSRQLTAIVARCPALPGVLIAALSPGASNQPGNTQLTDIERYYCGSKPQLKVVRDPAPAINAFVLTSDPSSATQIGTILSLPVKGVCQ